MKSIFSTIAILTLSFIAVHSKAAQTADSLVVQFANKTKMVIYAPNKAGIQGLSAYDLNKIVRDMGMKLDSVPSGQTYVLIDETTGNTICDINRK